MILIAVIDWGWKKVYDERDLKIEGQAAVCGWVGALAFIALAGWCLTVASKMGFIRAVLILFLVYLAFFISIVVLSIVALIQYGRGARGDNYE
jgi:apolipoprotein N-acyltransferase